MRSAPAPADRLRVPDLESGDEQDVPLFWRPDLEPGVAIEGPAVIAEDETSTFIPGHFGARVAANHYLVIERHRRTDHDVNVLPQS